MILDEGMYENFEKFPMKIHDIMWQLMHFVRRRRIESCKWIKKAI